jgi:hypothetical protein
MASGTIPPSERQVIGTRMREMGSELQPPAEQVTGGFMTAAQEAFSGGEGMNYEQLSQKLGEAWEAVENAIRNAGQELANKVCEFLLQDSAEGAMGEAVGWLAGTIVFEVILGILTAGSVTAAKGGHEGTQGLCQGPGLDGRSHGSRLQSAGQVGWLYHGCCTWPWQAPQ